MIVSDRPDGSLQLVPQVNHAHVSGEIARAWRHPAFFTPSLWEEFATAVYHHDDGWATADASPRLDDNGRPLNFKNGPASYHAEIWRQSIQLAHDQLSPFAELFIATHIRWLYTRVAAHDTHAHPQAPDFKACVEETINQRLSTLTKQAKYKDVLTPERFEQNRRLFSFFDAMSLVFSKGLDWISFTDNLPVGQDVQKMKVHSEICAIRWGRMTPWPFVADDVTFRLTYKRVTGKAYTSSDELEKALTAARPITQPFTLGRL